MKMKKIALILLCGVLAVGFVMPFENALADETTPNNGLVLDKTVSGPVDDVYTLTLEAYATGSKIITQTSTQIPTDIVLVLDQSGSMADPIGYTYTEITTKTNSNYRANRNSLWYRLDDGTYVSVSVNAGTYAVVDEDNGDVAYFHTLFHKHADGTYHLIEKSSSGEWGNTVYTCTSSSCTYSVTSGGWDAPDFNGEVYYLSERGNQQANANTVYIYTYTIDGVTHTIATSTGANTDPGVTFYTRVSAGSRYDALITALEGFSASVADKAKGADGTLGTTDDVNHRIAIVGFGSEGTNTELFIGSTQYAYEDDAAAQYGNAFQSMNTEAGVNNVNASIDSLAHNGATRVDLGMEMANGILNANPVPAGQTRYRVVIVFTDGSPTTQSTFSETVANSAIDYANIARNTHGATVYAVGVFSGADATSAGAHPDTSGATEVQKCNWFMQNVSDNEGTPQTPSYYLSAGDSTALSNIFQSISSDIESGGSSVTLDENAIIKDVISDQFELPANADASSIKVYTADYTAADTFATEVEFTDAEITISEDNRNVSVSNFDYAENWVGTETVNGTVSYRGKKLIIEIPIVVRNGFLGGNNVLTNGAGSGVYENASATDPVGSFTSPEVDVVIKPVTVSVANKNIYLYGSLTTEQLLEGSVIKCGDVVLDLAAENYGLAPWQTAYVNIPEASGLNNIVEDKSYTVDCTVSPKDSDGSAKTQSGSATGNIYVYKPVQVTTDSAIYLSQTAPAYNSTNMGDLTWKHGTTDSTSVTMIGEEPNVTYSYDPVAGAFTTDTDVNITAKIGETNIDSYITYTGAAASDHEFTVYVYKPVVTFADMTIYLGETPDFTKINPSVEWVNAAATVKPSGTEPALTYAYEPVSTAYDVDTYVKVTVQTGGKEIAVEFAHTACNPDCGFNPDKGEFIVHIKTCTLTIRKSGTQSIDENQSYIFVVTGSGNNKAAAIKLTVTIQGNGTATVAGLPVGTYTVTEQTDWSWRYQDVEAQSDTVSSSYPAGEVSFTNKRVVDNDANNPEWKWLGGDAVEVNKFTAASTKDN